VHLRGVCPHPYSDVACSHSWMRGYFWRQPNLQELVSTSLSSVHHSAVSANGGLQYTYVNESYLFRLSIDFTPYQFPGSWSSLLQFSLTFSFGAHTTKNMLFLRKVPVCQANSFSRFFSPRFFRPAKKTILPCGATRIKACHSYDNLRVQRVNMRLSDGVLLLLVYSKQ
jgi:hypothetical protein